MTTRKFLLAALVALAPGLAFAQTAMRPGVTREVTGSATTDAATSKDFLGWIAWKSTATQPKAQTLPACNAANNGMTVGIIDEQGTAGAYPISITAASGTVGVAGMSIEANYGSAWLVCNGTAANWMLAANNLAPMAGTAGAGNVPQTTGQHPIDITTATTTQLIAGSAGKYTYVTNLLYLVHGTDKIQLEYGTGATCTSPTLITGPLDQSGSSNGGSGALYVIPQLGASVCAITTGTGPWTGSISYTQSEIMVGSWGGGGGGGSEPPPIERTSGVEIIANQGVGSSIHPWTMRPETGAFWEVEQRGPWHVIVDSGGATK
jgi:hypothetical protein